MSALTTALFLEASFLQADGRSGSQPPPEKDAGQANSFIVEFELSEENGFDFTWPFESMKPAPYDVVIMAVGKMPRVWNENGGKESQQLVASRHLKINGRTQKPHRTANKQTYFLVKLDQGRLRISLFIPPQFIVDPQHRTASIKLYQVEKN
jgi:hypothetical protein